MPGLCPPGTGDLVASRPCNTFMTTTRQTGTISPSQSSGEAGRPGLPRRHRHHPFRSHAALGDRAAPAGLGNSAVCVAPLASLADIRRLAWGCSPEERSRLYFERKRPLTTIPGGAPLGSSDNKRNSPKSKEALSVPFRSAGATLRPYQPQWCRSLTTCNSRRRAWRPQTAAASSFIGCATKACASPIPPSRRPNCSLTSVLGSKRAPARRSCLLSR